MVCVYVCGAVCDVCMFVCVCVCVVLCVCVCGGAVLVLCGIICDDHLGILLCTCVCSSTRDLYNISEHCGTMCKQPCISYYLPVCVIIKVSN